MLHFAYGSNMDRRLMRRRCAGARLVGGAVLRDHRFIITTDGYASVAASLPVQVGGRAVRALVYVGRSGVPGRPRLGYMELVAAAARDAGLPAGYVATLERIWDMPSRSAVAPNGESYGQRRA
jgi:hypothetical protein